MSESGRAEFGRAGATPRRWVGVLLLFAVLAVVFLVPLQPAEHHPRLFNKLSNAAHLPILAGFTAVLFFMGFARRSLAKIGMAGCVTAILVEVAQPFFGRSAAWTDVLAGCLGVACVLGGIVVWRPGGRRVVRWIHGFVALGLLLATLTPALNEWAAIRWRERTFPVLSDFEDDQDLRLWEIRGGTRRAPSSIARSESFASSGRNGLRVSLGAGSRAALWYRAGSRNWEPYETLRFDIFNPGPPFRLGVRVMDGGSGSKPGLSYGRTFNVKTGLNEFRLPLSKIRKGSGDGALDMTRIALLSLFPRIGEPPRQYFLDDVRLE